MIVDTIAAVVFDLDGVMYRGDTPLPDAGEAVARLREMGKKVLFCSNNSSRTRSFFVKKLLDMGIEAHLEEMMGSSFAAALYIKDNGLACPTAYIIGEEGVFAELGAVGVRFLDEVTEELLPDYVVVGIDRQFTYDKLRRAQYALLHGSKFIATNRDATYPTEAGVLPGAGTMVAAVETAAGCAPILIGKPETILVRKLLQLHNVQPSQALMVGDRLDTDIVSGNRVGMPTALVLTGVTDELRAKEATGDRKPQFICGTLGDLFGE